MTACQKTKTLQCCSGRLLSLLGRTLLAGAVACAIRFASAAELQLDVRDADGSAAVVRARVRDRQGTDHLPAGAQVVVVGKKDRWFVMAGEAALDVPPGLIEVRIERGTEYRPIKKTFEAAAGSPSRHEFAIERWIDMRQRGYVCGENHLHVPPAELAGQLAAEGLDFGTVLQWWNGPRIAVPEGRGFVRDLTFAGAATPTSIYDVELEHGWGAAYIIGLPTLLDAKDDPGRPNLPIVRASRQAEALVCYQGGWSREVLLDALLGEVHVVNVCNNNFARHHFQPRSRYSNLLNVADLPTYPDTPEGMMRMNTDTYYRLLNCGLRLAAGGGTATGAKTSPVGYNRAYVRAGRRPSLPEFLDGWRKGRNFVTNGPMLFLRIDGRVQPGETVELPQAGGEVAYEVQAVSQQPLTSIELVVNGEVVAEAKPTGTKGRLAGKQAITAGSWIAARCTEEDRLLTDEELSDYSFGDKRMPRRPCRLRFAHTSPVYVTVGGRGARVEVSIHEAERMLDAFEVFAGRNAADRYRAELAEALAQAREALLEGGR